VTSAFLFPGQPAHFCFQVNQRIFVSRATSAFLFPGQPAHCRWPRIELSTSLANTPRSRPCRWRTTTCSIAGAMTCLARGRGQVRTESSRSEIFIFAFRFVFEMKAKKDVAAVCDFLALSDFWLPSLLSKKPCFRVVYLHWQRLTTHVFARAVVSGSRETWGVSSGRHEGEFRKTRGVSSAVVSGSRKSGKTLEVSSAWITWRLLGFDRKCSPLVKMSLSISVLHLKNCYHWKWIKLLAQENFG